MKRRSKIKNQKSKIAFLATWLLSAAPLLAQPAASDPGFAPRLGDGPMLWELFLLSPVINGIILLLSVVAVLMFIYFMLTITPQAMAPAGFVDEVSKLVRGREHKQAADFCRRQRGVFIASIIQRCVENAHRPQDVVMNMLDAEGKRRADIVWNRISYLSDIAAVAPMFGLLGTVVGMIRAFFYGLSEGSASISSVVLSRSIGQAMGTTMFGLIVGILALLFYSVVKGRLTRSLADAEQAVHSLADQLHGGDAA